MSEAIDPSGIDECEFWGIVLKEGRVSPPNIDHEIFYPREVVRAGAERVLQADVRIDHIELPGKGGAEDSKIGEIKDYRLHDDKLFVKGVFQRDLWEQFKQSVSERQNVLIQTRYNDLVREVHAGNVALSAGLSVAQIETDLHPHTVAQIAQIGEVSMVGTGASPASYAWACDDKCRAVFGEN